MGTISILGDDVLQITPDPVNDNSSELIPKRNITGIYPLKFQQRGVGDTGWTYPFDTITKLRFYIKEGKKIKSVDIELQNVSNQPSWSTGTLNGLMNATSDVNEWLGGTAIVNHSLSANLVSYYKLDGNSDDSTGLNDGTDTNITYAAGKIGQAAIFDGTAYVQFPNNAFNYTGDFSLSLWVWPNAFASTQSIFSSYQFPPPSNGNGYQLFIETTGKIIFDISYSNVADIPISSIGSLNAGAWNHIVMTKQASGGTTFYINGVLDYADGNVVNPFFDGTISRPTIGARKYSAVSIDQFLTGKMDEVGVWDRVITDAEALELWNSGAGKTYPL